MKANLFKITVGLFLAAVTLTLQPLVADDAPTPPPPPAPGPGGPGGPGHGDHFDFLTPEEKQELKTAREAVFTANPDLKKQDEALHAEGKALHEDPNSTPEDKQAFMEKRKAFEQTLHEAMLKQDPNLQPIFDKIAAHMKDHGPKPPQ